MSKGLVTIFGGSGFVGRYTTRQLVKAGYRVRIACRCPGLAGDAKLAGGPGWVDVVQANVRNKPSILHALSGADYAINLVGILHEAGKQDFTSTQSTGAQNIAELAAQTGLKGFVHVSAIGADAASKSKNASTKAKAEEAVRTHFPAATILRPSVIFGPEDQFFNRFAGMTRVSPFLPAIGGGKTKLQPVYAGDVAEAITAAITNADARGKTYELGGPRIYTFNEIYDTVMRVTGRKRFKAPLPFFVAKPLGLIFGGLFRFKSMLIGGLLGGPPITGDQVEMLKTDNVVSNGALGLADLGVTELESVEAIVPKYLYRYRPYGEFSEA